MWERQEFCLKSIRRLVEMGCPVYRKKAQKPLVWEGHLNRAYRGYSGGMDEHVGIQTSGDRSVNSGLKDFYGEAWKRYPTGPKFKITVVGEITNEDSTPSLPVWRGSVWVNNEGDLSPTDLTNFPIELHDQEIEIYLAGEKK